LILLISNFILVIPQLRIVIMGMGIVSDKDFDTEKGKVIIPVPSIPIPPSSSPSGIIVDTTKGRGEGNVAVPNSLRKLIGDAAITGGRQEALELAASFGISGSSASAYGNGSHSTSSYNDRPNASHITKSKERISKRARHKLMAALRNITEDKLVGAKARDLAGIAKDMSTVVKQMEETENPLEKGKTGPTFVFYSPQVRNEQVFDVVHAKE
jgi:hypothetical protein